MFVDKNAAGYMIIVVKRKSNANDSGLGFVSFCALSLLININTVLRFVYIFFLLLRICQYMGSFMHMCVSAGECTCFINLNSIYEM